MFKNNERVGVSIVDISLKSLANFLKSQIIGKRGYSFIIDENGKLVCFPEMSEVSEKDRSGKPVLKNIVDLKQYPYLIKAYAEFAQGNGTSILVSGKNLEHIVKFIDFPSEFGKQWKLVLTAPEEDFIQNVKQNNIISVAASAIVLLLSLILIYIVSRNIANPIVMLTHETDRIKELDLNSHLTIDSSIKEIRHISDSIARMRSGLQAFKKYVPAALVKQLIETGEEARLGGKNEFLTVFFSDIKDFTEISEGLPPEYLGLHLSEYLDEMTKIIVDNKGTVDKYIGDSIMAFWGAPAKDLKQEIHACRAAVLCQRKIKSLNEKWIHERKPKLETRIGIHTGPTVVGNIGSSDRMNYTVLGDSVNLTSRLEGVNKIYGSNIIISEITYTQLGEEFVARPLDYVVVKGKKEPIKIYHLMDLNDEGVSPDSLQLADLSLKAFEFYLDKKFKDSLQILDEILALYPKDKASMILKARCKNLLDCPPDDTWTGARTGLRMIDLLGPQIDIDES
jgi:adenylate cyclase